MIIFQIIGILAIFLLGYLIINLLLPKTHFLEKLSVGFLIGSGLFTFILFLLNLQGVPYDLLHSSVILIGLIIITVTLNLALKRIKYLYAGLNNQFKGYLKFSSLEKTFLIIILLLLVFSFINTLSLPVKGWDALVLYDFRAKLFVETGSMNEAVTRGYFDAYPLYTTLMHTWIYLLGILTPMFFYSLIMSVFTAAFYFGVRRITSRLLSLIMTLVMITTTDLYSHIYIAYTNLPYSVFLVLGSIYLYLFICNKNVNFLILSALTTGLSTWVRSSEPFWLVHLTVLVIFIVNELAHTRYLKQKREFLNIAIKNIPYFFCYLFIFLILQAPWKIFVAGLSRSSASVNPLSSVTLGINVISSNQNWLLFRNVWDFINLYVISPHLLLFVAAFLSLILRLTVKNRSIDYSLIFFGHFLMLLAGTYVFASFYSEWQNIPDSLRRMAIFFAPMILFLITSCVFEKGTLALIGKFKDLD